MKRSSLPQLLAAPAVAGLLLFSSVDSAQAKSYDNNDLISSAAIGIFLGMAFSGIATYLVLNLPHKDLSKFEKAIFSKIDKLDSEITIKINNVSQISQKSNSEIIEKISTTNQNISKLHIDVERFNSDMELDMKEKINSIKENAINLDDNLQNRIAETEKEIKEEIVRSAGEIRGYIKNS